MNLWHIVVQYYTAIGEKYHVDPIIFVGIHVVATPVFAAVVAWIIYNSKHKKTIIFPAITAVFVFNAASIYLIIFGKGIPYYIYSIVGISALVSGYFTFTKIKKRITSLK